MDTDGVGQNRTRTNYECHKIVTLEYVLAYHWAIAVGELDQGRTNHCHLSLRTDPSTMNVSSSIIVVLQQDEIGGP